MNSSCARRPVHGIVLVDKPAGITSNATLQCAKRLFRATKGGHTGNLDAPASGLLPICLGEATKVTPYLLDADKEYVSRIRFGVRTSTGDAAGEIVEARPVPVLSPEVIDSVLQRFTGTIEQVPPMYSALKHEGERLYRLATRGITVERRPRRVTVHALERLALEEDLLEVRIRCTKGTYVRVLAEDVGAALGTCAHVLTLRRTGVGPFRVADASTLEQMQERLTLGLQALGAMLLPIDAALPHLPSVTLQDISAHYVRSGQAVRAGRPPAPGLVRLYDGLERFMGIGETLADGRIAPRRLLNLS
jgi:tRNA pseudouridine55 synthase